MIKNPVLKGFHPDPSIICVDDTFYIANSTFEYYPPLQISKSKDLANWENLGGVLDNRHISLIGNPPSGGIWAPCLSYDKGMFYIVYSDIKTWCDAPFKDVNNYITSAPSITGPWSEGIYINSSGFDASLFHDGDRKYFINMEWDWRKKDNKEFSGILITELDPISLKPISKPIKIFKGTDRGLVEGPHLLKRNDYYYIIAAEGGTSYEHAVTIARAKNILGPYEVHPNKFLTSSYNKKDAPLQKTGHGSICQGPDGRWFLATLCGRPLKNTLYCPLGRETAINEIIWKDDWPYLLNETLIMSEYFNGYGEEIEKENITKYEIDSEKFKKDFISLREPCEYKITKNNEVMISGGCSPISRHQQKLLARRVEDFKFEFSFLQEFKADNFQNLSGLMYRYDEQNFYYLYISKEEQKDIINIYTRIGGIDKFPLKKGLELQNFNGKIILKLSVKNKKGYFSYKTENTKEYIDIPYKLKVKYLSDEGAKPMGFTGGFVGMEVIDFNYKIIKSKFKNITYISKDN